MALVCLSESGPLKAVHLSCHKWTTLAQEDAWGVRLLDMKAVLHKAHHTHSTHSSRNPSAGFQVPAKVDTGPCSWARPPCKFDKGRHAVYLSTQLALLPPCLLKEAYQGPCLDKPENDWTRAESSPVNTKYKWLRKTSS